MRSITIGGSCTNKLSTVVDNFFRLERVVESKSARFAAAVLPAKNLAPLSVCDLSRSRGRQRHLHQFIRREKFVAEDTWAVIRNANN
jgi:hypothetical protein